jgi:8-oxo-dGTP diphosphatase
VTLRCSAILFRAGAVLLLRRPANGSGDCVLPGGQPRPGESTASCVRREVLEETGLRVAATRVAFVLDAVDPAADHANGHAGGVATTDIVFLAEELSGGELTVTEPGLIPCFVGLDDLAALPLRPPIGGHLRGLARGDGRHTAPYLGNLWRPVPLPPEPPPPHPRRAATEGGRQ